jgi:hypothetical protein
MQMSFEYLEVLVGDLGDQQVRDRTWTESGQISKRKNLTVYPRGRATRLVAKKALRR